MRWLDVCVHFEIIAGDSLIIMFLMSCHFSHLARAGSEDIYDVLLPGRCIDENT